MAMRLEIDEKEVPVESRRDLEELLASDHAQCVRAVVLVTVVERRSSRFERALYKVLGLRLPQVEEQGTIQVLVADNLAHMSFRESEHDRGVVAVTWDYADSSAQIQFLTGHGEPFVVRRERCVPLASAWRAVLEFYDTGRRPTSVAWANDAR
jgi:hypothetical protein